MKSRVDGPNDIHDMGLNHILTSSIKMVLLSVDPFYFLNYSSRKEN